MLLTVVVTGVQAYEFFTDIRTILQDEATRQAAWLDLDKKEYAKQFGELTAIRKEMATQSLLLSEIRETQKRRFEELEGEHKWVVGEVYRGSIAMALELGRVSERTRGEAHDADK